MSKHTPEPWNDKRIDIAVHYFESINAEIAFTGKSDESMANARRIVTCVNACAGMEDPVAEIAELKRQRDELFSAISAIAEEVPHHRGSRGNAPGHGHSVVGIWDNDNGALAGKECGWCKAWRCAVDIYNKTKGGAA